MRLRELNFPIVIRYPNELEGGRHAALHNHARFDWSVTTAYEDGRFDDAEIIDSSGRSFHVAKIYFERAALWRWFLDRLGYLLVFPRPDRKKIVRVDMELSEFRTLTLDAFKVEFRNLILAHPAWWKRYRRHEEVENLFRSANSFADAINEIGFLSPTDFMVYRGKSKKIVDLR